MFVSWRTWVVCPVESPHILRRLLEKLKIELPCDPTIPLLGMHLKKKHDPQGYTQPTVHCSTVYNGQDMEAT